MRGWTASVAQNVCSYEKPPQAGNLAELLAPAERDVESGKIRPMREFMEAFTRGKNIEG